MPLTRRDLLAAAAALSAPMLVPGRLLGQIPASGEVDVAIVGAGAAGLAAARKLAAANRTYALLEASERPGGRAITDTQRFGVPYDLGAHWLHVPRRNPLLPIAKAASLDVYDATRLQRLRLPTRDARDGETEDFGSALRRANRAIITAGEAPRDMPASRAVPDLGEWQASVALLLGPLSCGKDLDEVSAADFAKSEERDEDAFCRQGLGAILALAAIPLTVRSTTPVTEIDYGGSLVRLTTPRGTVRARAVIVTASTGVLAAGKIRFAPALPPHVATALQRLSLGSYNHIALELIGNPLHARDDEAVYFKSADSKSTALLTRISGTDLAFADVGGRFGRSLEQAGEAAMVDFATEVLVRHYGADIRKSIGRTHATRWGAEPWIMGAFSAASPGGQSARRALAAAIDNRLFFAGEATHETMWGTVGGAWLSGERAADMALRVLPPPVAAPPPVATSGETRQERAAREREERERDARARATRERDERERLRQEREDDAARQREERRLKRIERDEELARQRDERRRARRGTAEPAPFAPPADIPRR